MLIYNIKLFCQLSRNQKIENCDNSKEISEMIHFIKETSNTTFFGTTEKVLSQAFIYKKFKK